MTVTAAELEWTGAHAKLSAKERDQAVDDLIALVGAVDGIVQAQAKSDAGYSARIAGRSFTEAEVERIESAVLAAYRWQYIVWGVQHVRFGRLMSGMTTKEQMARIEAALEPILSS